MATTIHCPACNQLVSVDVPPGTPVQCPLCNQIVTVPGTATTPMQEGPAPLQYGVPAGGQIDQGTAVGALVCGILGLVACPLVGIAGIIMGASALKKIKLEPNRYGGRGLALAGIWTGAVSIVLTLLLVPLMIIVMIPAFTEARGVFERMPCQMNLSIIASALQTYASEDDHGAFPEDINQLIAKGDITTQQLACPSDVTGQRSYYYVPGYSLESDFGQILMYEDPNVHGGEGGHIMYVDGQVEFVNSPQFEEKIDAITLPNGASYAPHKD